MAHISSTKDSSRKLLIDADCHGLVIILPLNKVISIPFSSTPHWIYPENGASVACSILFSF
jgi:hypothetical protein